MREEFPAGIARSFGDLRAGFADLGVDRDRRLDIVLFKRLEQPQNPTRMPYSCQAQFGTSGTAPVAPPGGSEI
jgi:hypothetical protein